MRASRMKTHLSKHWRFRLGLLFFALLFFYFGVRVYFVFFHVGSYDGWQGEQRSLGEPGIVTKTDPNGPATVLHPGDEVVAINGITPRQDPSILSFAGRVSPGTPYTITVRRNGQAMTFLLVTVENLKEQLPGNGQKFMLVVFLIFLLTGFFVFLLKPDDDQAWYLALMLGTYTALSTWIMPLMALGRVVETIVRLVTVLGIWSLPFLVKFFLIFPDRSPILKRWPKLERYLYWPFFIGALPYFGGARLPEIPRLWYFNFPPIKWLNAHHFLYLPMPTLTLYLVAGLVCLIVNYRVAGKDARRRLRVIMFGSGTGIVALLLAIIWEAFGLQQRMPQGNEWIGIGITVTTPLIPLSFAYAIIRHKVIPISLIIRRGVRYMLVTRGAIFFESITAILCAVVYVRLFFRAWEWKVVTISAAIGIAAWKVIDRLHRRYVAPAIDRRFFRQVYNAQKIMAELADALRSTTNRAELLELGATKIQSALQTEHVTILLPDEATKEFASAYSRSYDGVKAVTEIRLAHNDLTVQRLRISNQPLEVDEALDALPAALLVPLKGNDQLSGIIALGARRGDLPFSNDDKHLLQSVAAPMSFALENTRLIERMVDDARRREELEAENEARAKELEEARQLQLSMLPKRVPQLPHLEIAAYMKTATEVGGDYYDFHVSSDGTLTIAVGDATGHGLKAGTVVTAMKGLFHTHAQNDELLSVLSQSSHALKAMNLRSLFMALTLVKLHGNEMHIAAAGMPPTLIYHAATNTVEEVLMKTMPLGSLRNYPYREAQFTLQTGDVVVLLSDGFPERFNADGEILGFDKAQEVLEGSAHLPAQQIIEQFLRTEEQWAQGFAQNDDVTFVVLKVK